MTNEVITGSLTLEDFRIDGVVRNEDPQTSVEDHLDAIFSEDFDAPMFHDEFSISAYVPTNKKLDASELIDAAKHRSVWISNFKKNSATMSISKLLAVWLEQTLQHSTKHTRSTSSFRPALGKDAYEMKYQECVSAERYMKDIQKNDGDDYIVYQYPECLRGPVWNAFIRNPFDLNTRKDFLSGITFDCVGE
jgi:hypothetical protein